VRYARAVSVPQAIGDLINGTNQYMFITSLPVVELIESVLRALAVTGPRRIPVLKDADDCGAGLS
jgi:hypothetical protein